MQPSSCRSCTNKGSSVLLVQAKRPAGEGSKLQTPQHPNYTNIMTSCGRRCCCATAKSLGAQMFLMRIHLSSRRNDFKCHTCTYWLCIREQNNSCPIHYIKCTWLMCQIFPLIPLCSLESCCLSASHLLSLLLSLGFPLIFLLFSLSWYPPPRSPSSSPVNHPLPRWCLLSFRLSSQHLLTVPVPLTLIPHRSHIGLFLSRRCIFKLVLPVFPLWSLLWVT